jgi:acetoin utilization deacetylase AcuC-like enzyme
VAIVVSGVDPYEKDELPSTAKIRLTRGQLRDRDRLVFRFLEERSVPRAYLMAGGYGKSSWEVYSEFLKWALLRHLFAKDGEGL